VALRRRRESVGTGGHVVPVALLDVDDSAWVDVAATKAWARVHGLTFGAPPYGPLSRHKAAMEAWAENVGIVRPLNASSTRMRADWAALRALGIPAVSSGRHAMERLAHAGVTIEEN
jgi:hypothetical protein